MRKMKNKGRKYKKHQKKLYTLGDGKRLLFSYSENRKICRQTHELSIVLSRVIGIIGISGQKDIRIAHASSTGLKFIHYRKGGRNYA